MNRFTPTVFALLAAIGLTGCPPPDEGRGELDTLSFDWRLPAGGQRSVDIPLAEGTRGILQVQSDDGPPIIREADSSNRDILRVISVADDLIHLEAVGPGTTTVEVFTDRGNDWLRLQVQAVDRVSLSPKFSATRVLQGGVDVLHARRFGPFGGELVGHAPLALTFEPADGAALLPSPTHELRLSYPAPGEVRVNTVGGSLRRVVVERDALRTLEVFDTPPNLVAGELYHAPLAIYDGDGVRLGGLEGLLAVQSADTDVCDARLDAAGGEPAVRVEARTAGRCAISVALDGLAEDFAFDILR